MSEKKYTVALVGAGPASLYAAEVLAKAGHEVVILNRDIKPGGLAEFGIYPTKYKMKEGLRKYFARILARDNVHYFGNVRVGLEGDIALAELRAMGVDAVVVAVGAQGTKWLGLAGEDAVGSYHAKDLVYYYNGLPPFSEREFAIGKHVCVIGLGNVCMDIVHWMVCDRRVECVTAVARRGPGERAYTDKEFKIVCGAIDVAQIERELAAIGQNVAEVGQNPQELLAELLKGADDDLEVDSDTRFCMRFLRSPARVEVSADGRVSGMTFETTRLVALGEDGRVGLEMTGEFETIACDTVVFAVGDSIEPSLGLPVSRERRGEFATVPTPWEQYPDRPRYMVYDPALEQPVWDTFVVGWARRASDGLVGKARADAVQGCDEIMAYLNGQFEQKPEGGASSSDVMATLRDFLKARNIAIVDFEAVKVLEELEQREASARGVREFKFTSRLEMLRLLGS
ncbi:MAG: FAD-dependent oxidoreductase [Bradymonadaceae bacterium]|nr:FAD-dependent oxidoreductase [Lujinxingiaceae bacterium]